jgi:hypothetical protein
VPAEERSRLSTTERDFVLDGGTVTWGHEASVGYFSQDHAEGIDMSMRTLDYLALV